jgi:phosphatidylinositol alpha-mannosyltransferase
VRIGIVSDYYYPQLGGITEHAYGQAIELSRRGHEVSLITPNLLRVPKTVDDAPPRPEPFQILRVGRAYPFYINASETLMTIGPRLATDVGRLLSRHEFDVLHVHNPFGISLPIISILRSRARATVGTIHSVVPEDYLPLRLLRRPLNKLFGMLDARIAVSDAVVASVGPYFPGLSFDIIPNAVDTSFFTPAAEPLPWLAGMKHNVLFVGRFDPRNGLREMLRAFVLFRQRRDDVRLIVVGDGPLRPVYERTVPTALRGDVLFEGRIDGLRPRYLASSDVLCTPCHLASFGMVLLESMSAGVPVVASNIPGFRLLLQDGQQGVLVDHDGEGRRFCDALDFVLDNPALAREMGRAGRERAVEMFSWQVVGDQLEGLYERLLRQRQARRVAQYVA